ncbi:MAG TPA: hypothetical protein VM468_13435 [Mycoplana sp.]|nr:hypothetical protein [Mycoplana sp.]
MPRGASLPCGWTGNVFLGAALIFAAGMVIIAAERLSSRRAATHREA